MFSPLSGPSRQALVQHEHKASLFTSSDLALYLQGRNLCAVASIPLFCSLQYMLQCPFAVDRLVGTAVVRGFCHTLLTLCSWLIGLHDLSANQARLFSTERL